jgi:hypothetical protein
MTRRSSKEMSVAWEKEGRVVSRGNVLYSLVCLISLLCQFQRLRVGEGLSDDGVALLAVKRSISVDPFHVLANWNEKDADPCAWCGVTCSEARRVVALNFPGLGLLRLGETGPECKHDGVAFTPSSLPCQLHDASRYAIARCSSDAEVFHGMRGPSTCASALDRLSSPICFQNGSVVDATSGFHGEGEVPCVLYGTLPREIGNLSELVVLSLPFNGLSGEVPKEIGSLKYLEMLT